MSWLFTFTRRLVSAAISVTAVALGAYTCAVGAQTLESAIMPGPVIQGHAKYESDCKNCHVRFDRAAQARLCLNCHKEVAGDVRAKIGYHGRLKEHECRSCHTEHKGRNATVVPLEEKTFDHAQTDFPLRGKHREAKCVSCHRPKVKHREAATECVGCHRKEDKHKDTLGAKCVNCHDENDWKKTHFDHAKTQFPLLHRHVQVKCVECHADLQHYAETSRECVSCHRKDDTHKGRFGPRCDKCHDAAKWKVPTFNHDRDTHYVLRDKHRNVKCETCHREPVSQAKTPSTCLACHRKEDVHKGALGEKCESCHTERAWKEPPRFDHDRDTPFALRDKHREAKCEGCHKDARLKEGRYREKPPSLCFGCHRREDLDKGHKGRYGEKCQSCHAEKAWKQVTFAHERDARFNLRGKHAQVKCDDCHKGVLYRDKTETVCYSCHRREDKHDRQLGVECERCHNERSWREAPFDHSRSRFQLLGRHEKVECKKCHTTLAFKDAKSECVACHAKDDYHKERLGPRCESCHNARDWKTWEYDHNRTRFKLTDRHAKVKCVACHNTPVKGKFVIGLDCASCHLKADDVHLGTQGTQCEKCHYTDNWRHIIKPGDAQGARTGAFSIEGRSQ